MNEICCLETAKENVKNLKNHLEKLGLLNKQYRITKLDNKSLIPITFGEVVPEDDFQTRLSKLTSCPFSILYIDKDQLLAGKLKTPQEKLQEFVLSYMKTKAIIECNLQNIMAELPKKWEIHGDLIMFPDSAFYSPVWNDFPETFWKELAELFIVKRVAVTSRIRDDGYRTPRVTIKSGRDGWVEHVDNGIKYTFDVTRNMFSKGNITEKLRISNMDCTDEVVVDLFAGIGYFVLPFLVKANAKKVIACEWNPDAVLALSKNLLLNNVNDKCEIREGDNRLVAPKGIANRVNLGLIPTSSASWRVACDALNRTTGGYLHIHENVESWIIESSESDDVDIVKEKNCACEDTCIVTQTFKGCLSGTKRLSWCRFTSACLATLRNMFDLSSQWNIELCHIEQVKSYAPHVDHLVFDIECRPRN